MLLPVAPLSSSTAVAYAFAAPKPHASTTDPVEPYRCTPDACPDDRPLPTLTNWQPVTTCPGPRRTSMSALFDPSNWQPVNSSRPGLESEFTNGAPVAPPTK